MANSASSFSAHAHTQQPQQQQQFHPDLTRAKQLQQQQQQAVAAAASSGGSNGASATQLQQRAAAAAQFLTAERKITSREIQVMLEKNDAALGGWNALHTQEPPKSMAKEHKEWVRKCLLYRQQVGARLEVLASLADKQIAIEDESAGERAKVSPTAAAGKAPYATGASASSTVPQQSAAKKSKASAALARQAAQSKSKAAAAAAAATASARAQPAAPAPAPVDSGTNALLSTASAMAPLASPTSFPEPPMPTSVPPQQFGYGAVPGSDGAFFNTGQSSAMASTGFTGASSMASFPMTGVQSFPGASYAPSIPNAADPTAAAFMSQQQQSYMMNSAAAMNMAMMSPQYLAMQMQMPPMGMYTSPAMFNSYGSGSAMGSNHQLPADPFNTSFNQPAFVGGPAAFSGYDAMGGMASASMMNPMGAFPMMPDQQLMMSAFPYGIPMAQAQSASTMAFPDPSASASGSSSGSAPSQAFAPLPSQSQPQQSSSQQPEQATGAAATTTATTTASATAPAPAPGADAFADSSSLFDDAMASNLFDGFPDDAFLQM